MFANFCRQVSLSPSPCQCSSHQEKETIPRHDAAHAVFPRVQAHFRRRCQFSRLMNYWGWKINFINRLSHFLLVKDRNLKRGRERNFAQGSRRTDADNQRSVSQGRGILRRAVPWEGGRDKRNNSPPPDSVLRREGLTCVILQSVESFWVKWTLWSVPCYYLRKKEEEENKCNNYQDLVWKF